MSAKFRSTVPRRLMAAAVVVASLQAPIASAQGLLAIGAEDDAAPWSYADGTGFVNDLVKRAFAVARMPVTLHVVPYARCKELTLRGEYAACFTTSKTPETENELLFPATPVITPRFLAFARRGSPLVGCDAPGWQKKPTVAYVRGYEYAPRQEALRAGKEVVEMVTDSEAAGLLMLQAKRVDAALVNLDEIKTLEMVLAQARLPADKARDIVVACDFGSQPGYLAFSRKHAGAEAALSAFEKGMEDLQKRGEIATLQKLWAKRGIELERAKRR